MTNPTVSIVTTCKGRLHHLVESLPSFLKQGAIEVIVVDYACPDHTAEFLADQFPAVRTVRVHDDGEFNLCKARNAGAKLAKGELLAFVDADIVLADAFSAMVAQTIQPGEFGLFKARIQGSINRGGTCIIPRPAFALVGGYDEVMVDVGGNDKDIYYRLKLSGLKPNTLEPSLIDRTLEHGNEERTRFRAIKDVQLGRLVTSCYRQLKNMILRLEGKLELDIGVRQNIYQYVKSEILKHHQGVQDFNLHINLPHDGTVVPFSNFEVSRMIVVKVTRKPPSAQAPAVA